MNADSAPPPWRAMAYTVVAAVMATSARYSFAAGNTTSAWFAAVAAALALVSVAIDLRRWQQTKRRNAQGWAALSAPHREYRRHAQVTEHRVHLGVGVEKVGPAADPAAPDLEASVSKLYVDMSAAIENDHPDDFAYEYFNSTGTMSVGFKGRIPPSAAAAISSSGLTFDVQEAVGYNRAEADKAVSAVRDQLGPFARVDSVYLSVAPTPWKRPGAITIQVHRSPPATDTPPTLTTTAPPFTLSVEDLTQAAPPPDAGSRA